MVSSTIFTSLALSFDHGLWIPSTGLIFVTLDYRYIAANKLIGFIIWELLFFHCQIVCFYSDRWSWWYYDWRRDLECNVGITSSYFLVMDHKMWGDSTTLNWPGIHTRQLRIIWSEGGEGTVNTSFYSIFLKNKLCTFIAISHTFPPDFSISYFHWDKSIHW